MEEWSDMRLNWLVILFFIVVVFGSDAYILRDIRKYVRSRYRTASTVAWVILSLLCWGLAVAFLCMPKRSEDADLYPQMWMLYTFLSIYIPKLIYCICSLVGRIFCHAHRNLGAMIGVPLAALLFVVMWWGVIFTRHDIVTNDVEIVSEKLPAAFDGFKIIQFSDAHLGSWGNDTLFVSRLVDSINSKHPDIILFTGDFVNQRSREFQPFVPVLSRLKAPYGVYGIYGNHDYAGYVDWKEPGGANRDIAKLDSMIRLTGMKMLKNQSDFIKQGKDSIVLIGVENWGEPPFNQLGDLGKSYPGKEGKFHGLNDDMFKILLTHNPEHWNQVATDISNIDLSLAGHTHAMQTMLKIGDWKWSPAQYIYENWGGLYEKTAKDGTPMRLYVNIGVGEVGFPARVGAAKPELTLITLKSK